MKKYMVVVLLLALSLTYSENSRTIERIQKYSGKNAEELTKLYGAEENGEQIRFILDYSSPNDLAVLTPDYITKNVELALRSRELKYSSLYDDDIFNHFVLPLRMTQEPFEDWRERFYNEIYPLVEDVEDIEKAAILVNIWAEEQMTYKPTHGKDQAPLTTIRRGYGRCEEMMIIYMAAARSVGIPVRSAGTPLWNFTDSNHAWVEVWTPLGWKYLGEPADQLNRTWFTSTTRRASLITSRAFGYYGSEDLITHKDLSTEISSIRYYTDQWDRCVINIDDSEGLPVEGAEVTLYAVSWGGIFPMYSIKSDKNGQVSIPLGKGSVFVSVYDENKGYGYGMFDTLRGSDEMRIELGVNSILGETELFFRFQIASTEPSRAGDKKYFDGKFDLMKNNASLKREQRLAGSRRTADFAKYFLKSRNFEDKASFYEAQKEFLKKSEALGGNTETFLKAFSGIDIASRKDRSGGLAILTDIIRKWDEKELCEIPDSAAVADLVDILYQGRQRYRKSVPDTIFTNNVIAPTWMGAQVAQNGWQKEFYETVKNLAGSNIKTAVKDVVAWADSRLITDPSFTYHYYSGHLNPLQILNMKNVPEFYRTKVIDSALKILGIPVRWKGSLEYFNGKEFVFVEPAEGNREEKIRENLLRLSIFIDGKKVKAEPWSNFQVSELSEGKLGYYYFTGENDSLDYLIKYPSDSSKKLFVQAGVRNSNGDSNIKIIPLSQDSDKMRIELDSPREYIDLTADFSEETLNRVKNYASSLSIEGRKVILIRGIVPNEPTHRMTDLLIAGSADLAKNGAKLIIHTELRDDSDIENSPVFLKRRGDVIVPETEDDSYPLVFLTDQNNEVIFAAKGYNMNIADIILIRVKNN